MGNETAAAAITSYLFENGYCDPEDPDTLAEIDLQIAIARNMGGGGEITRDDILAAVWEEIES